MNLHVPWSAGSQQEASWNTPSTSYNTTKELGGGGSEGAAPVAEKDADGFVSLAVAAGVRASILPPKQVSASAAWAVRTERVLAASNSRSGGSVSRHIESRPQSSSTIGSWSVCRVGRAHPLAACGVCCSPGREGQA